MWKSIENCILISKNTIGNTKYKIILSNIILLCYFIRAFSMKNGVIILSY